MLLVILLLLSAVLVHAGSNDTLQYMQWYTDMKIAQLQHGILLQNSQFRTKLTSFERQVSDLERNVTLKDARITQLEEENKKTKQNVWKVETELVFTKLVFENKIKEGDNKIKQSTDKMLKLEEEMNSTRQALKNSLGENGNKTKEMILENTKNIKNVEKELAFTRQAFQYLVKENNNKMREEFKKNIWEFRRTEIRLPRMSNIRLKNQMGIITERLSLPKNTKTLSLVLYLSADRPAKNVRLVGTIGQKGGKYGATNFHQKRRFTYQNYFTQELFVPWDGNGSNELELKVRYSNIEDGCYISFAVIGYITA